MLLSAKMAQTRVFLLIPVRDVGGVVIVTSTDFLQLLPAEVSAVSFDVSDIPYKLYLSSDRLTSAV
jgi:hypothetical protein